MRKSRVLLAGVAVAAAAAATSAFTASQTVDDSVAGYGEGTVTGAHITDFHYVTNGDDGTVVDAIEFSSAGDLTGKEVTLTLKDAGDVVGDPYACDVKTPWDNTTIVMSCDTTIGGPRNFADFDTTGVTVVQ